MIIAMKIVWDRLEIAYAIGKKPGVIRKALGMMLDIETSSIVKLTWLYETYAKDRKQWSVNIRVLCVADDRERASAKHERCGELAFFIFGQVCSVQTRLGVLTGMGLLITWHNTLIVVSSISKASLWFGR